MFWVYALYVPRWRGQICPYLKKKEPSQNQIWGWNRGIVESWNRGIVWIQTESPIQPILFLCAGVLCLGGGIKKHLQDNLKVFFTLGSN